MRTRQSGKAAAESTLDHVNNTISKAQPSSSEPESLAPVIREHDSFKGSAAAGAVDALESAIAEPAALIQPTAALASLLRDATKVLHDFIYKRAADEQSADEQQTALHVDGFDAEQIWSQLDSTGNTLLRRARKMVARSAEAESLLLPAVAARLQGSPTCNGDNGNIGKVSQREQAGLEQDMSTSSERHNVNGEADAESDEDGASDASEGTQQEGSALPAGMATGKRKASASAVGGVEAAEKRAKLGVEDDFLQMDDMEAFVQQAERRAAAGSDAESTTASEGSDDSNVGNGIAEDGAVESGSDEDLAALLESSSALVGRKAPARKPRGGKKAPAVIDSDASNGSADDYRGDMYDSFFDPKPTAGRNRRGEAYDEERSWHGSDSDGQADLEARAAADGDWDGDALFDTGEGRADVAGTGDGVQEGDDGDDANAPGLSKHERRTAAMRARIAAMEEAAMGEKDWFMRGEAQAAHRPLNSALELDLDFERTLQPPPVPTMESTRTLEDVIKARIADRKFEDVVRVAPPEVPVAKTALELDDRKNAKGLGELYEEEYLKQRAPTDAVEEKDAATKEEARRLLKALFVKLDALSHFHYAPKPIVEEMAVTAEVPALAMEEVAPQVASAADMRYAAEVFSGNKALPAGDTELSREDRKRARAGRKRVSRKQRAQKEAERKQKSAAAGGDAPIQGRRSEAARVAAAEAAKKDGKRGGRNKSHASRDTTSYSKGSDYTKSSKVFAKLADEQAASRAGTAPPKHAVPANGRTAASFKL